MTDDDHECEANSQLVYRAREHTSEWGDLQVLECRECGRRWSA